MQFVAAAGIAIFAALPLLADVASIRESIRNGRLADAIVECDKELKATPRSFSILTLKGLALLNLGDKIKSLAAFRQALSISPKYEPALQAAAQIEFEIRDSRASQTLESVLRLSPSSEPAHAMLATLLFESRSCEAALTHFELAPSYLKSPSIRWQYGVCLLDRQKWIAASKQFIALLQLQEHGPTRYNLALSYWNAKDYPSVVSTLLPLEDSSPDADVLRLLGSALEGTGDTPRAFVVMRKAIRRHPQDDRLLVELAVMCLNHNALDLGIEVVQAGIRATPTSARLQTLLGVLLVRSGDLDGGQAAFRRTQKLAPKSGLGSIGLASTMMQMGLASDAVRVLREQLAATGSDLETELTLARALLLNNRTLEENGEVSTILLQILKQQPGNAVAHGLLGKVYAQMGDNRQAIVELTTAIRIDPTDRTSKYQLMTIYKRTGRTKQAAELAREVRSLLEKEKEEELAWNRFQVVRENGMPFIH